MNRGFRLSRPLFAVVLGATFLSGSAALIYEVAWSRMLAVVVGNSGDAIALVLAAFMLGMALGAGFLGGLADRIRFPLRFYAGIELFIAICAVAVPFLLPALNSVEALRGTFEQNPTAAVGRMILVFAIIVIPALAMGATLPIVCRALTRNASGLKQGLGVIYGANTLGAAAGASAAGFGLIPLYGLETASFVGAGLSGVSALIFFVVAGLAGPLEIKDQAPLEGSEEVGRKGSRRVMVAALLALGVSGFAMLALEVLWSRILTFVFGHDTYAFSVLLSVVLVGLGLGGLLYRAVSRRNAVLVTGLLLGLSGLVVIDSYWIATAITVKYGRDPFHVGEMANLAYSLRLEFIREILFAPILVFLPALVAGATVPAACAVLGSQGGATGAKVGSGLLANGIGSAAGAVFAALAIVQFLGIEGAFIALSVLLAATSVAVFALALDVFKKWKEVYLLVPVMLMFLIISIMPSGQPRSMFMEAVGTGHQEILYYEEGRVGTVSVTKNRINGEKQLFVNSVNEVTTRIVHDQSFKLLGHLGPLLHSRPRTGLMICLGAGLSAGAALVHPLSKLDVVELSSGVYRAAGYWKQENNNVLDDPRLHVHFGDGRHFLSQSSERWDVIMVDSTHPKAVDSWILYTKEFYELLKSRIGKGGIAVQWVPLHGLSEREFKIILRTFLSVFPHMTLWTNVGFEVYGQAAYVKMVGTLEELSINMKELELRFKEPRIARDLKQFGMGDPIEVLDSFQAGAPAIDAWTKGLPIQTDNRPLVPYITDYSSGRRMEASLLLGVESPIYPHLGPMRERESAIRHELGRATEARGFLLAGLLERANEAYPGSRKIPLFQNRFSKAKDYYVSLGKLYADDGIKLFEIASYLGNLGHLQEARKLYREALEKGTHRVRAEINLALVEFDLGEVEEAKARLEKLVKNEPNNALINLNLGVILKEMNRPQEAAVALERALAAAPDLISAAIALADAKRQLGKTEEAEDILQSVLKDNHWVAAAWDTLGLLAQSRKDWERAKKMHVQALHLEPYRASAHYNLGIALEKSGRLQDAEEAYRAALRIDPNDPEAHNNLGIVMGALGNYRGAVESHRRALERDPDYAEAAYNMGLAWRALGEPERALEAFQNALKMSPELVLAEEQIREIRKSSGEE